MSREEASREVGGDDQASALPPAATDVDSLPIKLVFVAGELAIALRDLHRIAPGYVFDLRQPVDGHVEVRANGQVIGNGDLVELDGRVGVRIVACSLPAAP